MASVRKKGIYMGDDMVDEYFVHQVTQFVRYETLRQLAKELRVKERELEIIMAPNYLFPKDRISKVSNKLYFLLYS